MRAAAPDGEPVTNGDRAFPGYCRRRYRPTRRGATRRGRSKRATAQWPGWRPLHAAIEQLDHGGPLEAIILLTRNGASVDAWDARHEATPLLMAIFRGQREALHLLLALRAETNIVGAEGDSPLRWAVGRRDCGLAGLLLRCGADRTIDEAGGPSGMTGLGLAASQLDVLMVGLLLAAGANPRALDADRRTARDRLLASPDTNPGLRRRIEALLAGTTSSEDA